MAARGAVRAPPELMTSIRTWVPSLDGYVTWRGAHRRHLDRARRLVAQTVTAPSRAS